MMQNVHRVIPHLLLIDDDEEEMDILSHALVHASIPCQCTWAMGPMHGLKILKYFTPQFIFMDYNMPKMNGIECIRSIRETAGLTEIPIILYSSEVNASLREEALAAGAMDCIRKTANINQLADALKELFSSKRFIEQFQHINQL